MLQRGVEVEVEEWRWSCDDSWPRSRVTADQLVGILALGQLHD